MQFKSRLKALWREISAGLFFILETEKKNVETYIILFMKTTLALIHFGELGLFLFERVRKED